MHYTFRFLSFLVLSSFLFSCGDNSQANEEKIFFDLEKLIQDEVDWLNKSKPTISKYVKINDKEESLESNEIEWDKDLEILKQSDLNKAAYKLSYDINESPKLISYNLKEGESLPINSLLISKNDEGQIVNITSEHITDNYLYSSKKKAEMDLENGHLKRYSVTGWQKLFVGSTKEFEITGTVQ